MSIALVVFVDLLGFSIILPLLPFYAAQFHASDEMIGVLVATYSICQFIASPILGGMSDRFGRRPLLIYSQLGSCAGFILLGLANSLPILFLARVIDGLTGGNITVAQAYIADVTEPQDRAGAMAIIGIGFGLGFMVGPFIGGELAHHFGFAAPAYCAAALAFCSTMLSAFYLREHAHQPDANAKTGLAYYARVFDYFKFPTLRLYLLIFLFFALPFALYVSMFSLFAMEELHASALDVGRFLAYVGFLGVIWQGALVRRLVPRIGEVTSLRFGLICLTVGLVGLGMSSTWAILYAVGFVFSLGTAVVRPTLSSLITQAAPPDRKGGALGVSSSLESFSRSIAPVLGGWIIGSLHPMWLGYVGALLGTVAVVLSFNPRAAEVSQPAVLQPQMGV